MIFEGFSVLASRRSAQESKAAGNTLFIIFLKFSKNRKFSNQKFSSEVSSFSVEKHTFSLLGAIVGNPIETNDIPGLTEYAIGRHAVSSLRRKFFDFEIFDFLKFS